MKIGQWIVVALSLVGSTCWAAPGACSAGDSQVAVKARDKAREMLITVDKLIADGDSIAVKRMDAWLGVKNSAESKAIKERLSKAWAFLNGVTFICDRDADGYASVITSDPFKIKLRKLFFTTADTGYCSRPGTLVHEMTHFVITGDSDDPPDNLYGTAQALKLAKENPAKAQMNAENLEYFVEATVFGLEPPSSDKTSGCQ